MIMANNKRVLIIAYLFPPIGGGGVQRALKMAKYLGQFGWEPHVLTVDPVYHATLDHSLLQQLPENVKVHRANEIQLKRGSLNHANQGNDKGDTSNHKESTISYKLKSRLFPMLKKLKDYILIPDDQVLWFPQAVRKGTEVMRQYDIDMIFSTSGPYTNHLVGYTLKKRTNKPWIADFRDPWTQNMHRPGIKFREWIEEKMEANVMKQSDVLLTVTYSFAKNFKKKYGDQIKRLEVIHNGFDHEDYEGIEPVNNQGKFTMVYAGIFYKERNPRLLLQAVKELMDEDVIKREEILLKFAGVFDYPGYSENADCVNQLGLDDVVQVLGHLPHKQALREMKGANALLLINDVSEDAGNYIPGKLFEYMAIGQPILALSLPGESTNIIETYHLGEVVHPKSKQEMKVAIKKLFEQWKWKKGQPITEVDSQSLSSTKKYERKHQAHELAKLMDEIIKKA